MKMTGPEFGLKLELIEVFELKIDFIIIFFFNEIISYVADLSVFCCFYELLVLLFPISPSNRIGWPYTLDTQHHVSS